MADQIVYTPLKTSAVPNPAQVTFVPNKYDPQAAAQVASNFSFTIGPIKRIIEPVKIRHTDISYQRDVGRGFSTHVLRGTDTFLLYATAFAQLQKFETIQGATCAVTSVMQGGVTLSEIVCIDTGSPVILDNQFPGFHIIYTLIFQGSVT